MASAAARRRRCVSRRAGLRRGAWAIASWSCRFCGASNEELKEQFDHEQRHRGEHEPMEDRLAEHEVVEVLAPRNEVTFLPFLAELIRQQRPVDRPQVAFLGEKGQKGYYVSGREDF